MSLTKSHLNSHRDFLRQLLGVSKSRVKSRELLKASKVGQLRLLLRIIWAVGVKKVEVVKLIHLNYIERFVRDIRKIIHHISSFLKKNKETILPILMAMVSVLRYFVLPFFSPESQAGVEEGEEATEVGPQAYGEGEAEEEAGEKRHELGEGTSKRTFQ